MNNQTEKMIPTHVVETVNSLVSMRLIDPSVEEMAVHESDKQCKHLECDCGGKSAIFLMPVQLWAEEWIDDDSFSNDISVDDVHRAMIFDALIHTLVLRKRLIDRLCTEGSWEAPYVDKSLDILIEGICMCFAGNFPPDENSFWQVLRAFDIYDIDDVHKFLESILHEATDHDTRSSMFHDLAPNFVAGLMEVYRKPILQFVTLYVNQIAHQAASHLLSQFKNDNTDYNTDHADKVIGLLRAVHKTIDNNSDRVN